MQMQADCGFAVYFFVICWFVYASPPNLFTLPLRIFIMKTTHTLRGTKGDTCSHTHTHTLTFGGSQTHSPVVRFAYMWSLVRGSMISTHSMMMIDDCDQYLHPQKPKNRHDDTEPEPAGRHTPSPFRFICCAQQSTLVLVVCETNGALAERRRRRHV